MIENIRACLSGLQSNVCMTFLRLSCDVNVCRHKDEAVSTCSTRRSCLLPLSLVRVSLAQLANLVCCSFHNKRCVLFVRSSFVGYGMATIANATRVRWFDQTGIYSASAGGWCHVCFLVSGFLGLDARSHYLMTSYS